MKKSQLRQIIKEEYKTVTGKSSITENIVSKLITLILKPKIDRNVKELKNKPEYIELEQQAKLAVKNLEAITDKLVRVSKKQDELEKEAKKLGVKGYRKNMTIWELEALFDPIYKKLGKGKI
jgi:hypothetical protein